MHLSDSRAQRLAGKVALITGAARGQGRSHAMEFAREGADVVLIDICADIDGVGYEMGSTAQLGETTRRCRELGAQALPVTCDVRDENAVADAVAQAVDAFGGIDVLINNAGIGSPAGRAWELTEVGWQTVLDINLSGVWRCAKAVAPTMIERGKGGCILATSSAAGLKGIGRDANYVTSKHGLIGLMRSLAIDLAPYGIRSNCVCPGSVRDDAGLSSRMLSGVAEEFGVPPDRYEAEFASHHLLSTLMEARDISRAYVWLASEDGVRITGAVVPVDAGFVAK